LHQNLNKKNEEILTDALHYLDEKYLSVINEIRSREQELIKEIHNLKNPPTVSAKDRVFMISNWMMNDAKYISSYDGIYPKNTIEFTFAIPVRVTAIIITNSIRNYGSTHGCSLEYSLDINFKWENVLLIKWENREASRTFTLPTPVIAQFWRLIKREGHEHQKYFVVDKIIFE